MRPKVNQRLVKSLENQRSAWFCETELRSVKLSCLTGWMEYKYYTLHIYYIFKFRKSINKRKIQLGNTNTRSFLFSESYSSYFDRCFARSYNGYFWGSPKRWKYCRWGIWDMWQATPSNLQSPIDAKRRSNIRVCKLLLFRESQEWTSWQAIVVLNG